MIGAPVGVQLLSPEPQIGRGEMRVGPLRGPCPFLLLPRVCRALSARACTRGYSNVSARPFRARLRGLPRTRERTGKVLGATKAFRPAYSGRQYVPYVISYPELRPIGVGPLRGPDPFRLSPQPHGWGYSEVLPLRGRRRQTGIGRIQSNCDLSLIHI